MLDFSALARYCNIPTATQGQRHYRPGWEHMVCPFCSGEGGNHLGWNLSRGFFTCWRCGWHSTIKTLTAITNRPLIDIERLIKAFQTNPLDPIMECPLDDERALKCELPVGTLSADQYGHNNMFSVERYLEKRGFDRGIIEDWGLLHTGRLGSHRYRIVAPYTYNGELVTWQARDYTGKQTPPYLACPKAKSVLDVKETLYGYDQAMRNDKKSVVVVEGIVDTWRIGWGATAVSGTAWTEKQALMLSRWNTVGILFDQDEPQASKHAKRLAVTLKDLGVGLVTEMSFTNYHGDPGEMTEDMVSEVRRMMNWG